MVGISIFQGVVYYIHAKSGVDEVAVFAEVVVSAALSDCLAEFFVLFAVPGFLEGGLGEVG